MKQMIYRRAGGASTSTGGYAVTARAESITAMQRSEAMKHARIPALSDENGKHRVSFYRQYQLDADTLAVSCGFYDPHYERGSAIVQTAMTESREERARYLARMPAASGYFESVKADYTASGEFEIEKGDMMLPLETYFASAAAQSDDSLAIIKKEIGTEDAVREMFAALLDVASSNPRMIVAYMDAADLAEVGERGRCLAESLLACLPESVAAAVGFMSPATDDSENTAFGLRFAIRGNFKFSGAQNQAYVFDLASGEIVRPRTAQTGAEEYVAELTSLVMQGGAAALARVRELRAALEDPSCFKSKEKLKGKPAPSIPAEMSIRYALVARPERLERAEINSLLAWRHAMIDEALNRDSEGFGPMAFWSRVDAWTLNVCLPEMWRRQAEWKKGNAPYDPEAVLRVFEDSQRLHIAGREEAQGYQAFVAKMLTENRLYADGEILLSHLIRYFRECADVQRTRVPLTARLYFKPVENWLRTVWLNLRPAPRSREVLQAVEQLCAMDALEPEQLKSYVNGYADLIFDGRDGLYVSNESKFHAAVVDAVVRTKPERLSAAMRADLRGKNPYLSAGAQPAWLWYRALVNKAPGLEGEFLSMHRENLENALAKAGADAIPALADELRGAGSGMPAFAGRMDGGLNVREAIEKRIAALGRQAGVTGYYPDRIELAAAVSAMVERHEGGSWMREHEALRDVCAMNPAGLTIRDFDRFAGIVADRMRDEVVRRARELLTQAMMRVCQDPDNAPMESVLIGICMLAMEKHGFDLCFRPAKCAAMLETLGLREQKLIAYCKKNADADASEGVGYLADVMLSYLKTSEKKRADEAAAYPKAYDESGANIRRAPLAGLPLAVPIAGIAVFGSGLVASALGLMHCIGLI